jgi:hypothetical protein
METMEAADIEIETVSADTPQSLLCATRLGSYIGAVKASRIVKG